MKQELPFLGFDVGGTSVKAIAITSNGEIRSQESTDTADDGTDSWLNQVRAIYGKMRQQYSTIERVGVAAPGLPSKDGSSIVCMPGRLSGLENLNWQKWLGLDVPVPVLNDAQAALLGERWLGSAVGSSNIVFLTLGTGVGGAAMVDGRILHGFLGRAGHLGHVSLDPEGPGDVANAPGSLEDAIGDHTVHKRSNGQFHTTAELVNAFGQKVPGASEIWLRSVRALAAALAGFINILDPEIIIIGGGIAGAEELLFRPLQEFLDQFEWRPTSSRVRLVKAALGPFAGAIGAAWAAKMAVPITSLTPSAIAPHAD